MIPTEDSLLPVASLRQEDAMLARICLDRISAGMPEEWTREDGPFGSHWAAKDGFHADARLDEIDGGWIEIKIGSEGPSPQSGHWTASIRMISLPSRVRQAGGFTAIMRAAVETTRKVVELASSPRATTMHALSGEDRWDAARRYACMLAAEAAVGMDAAPPPMQEVWVHHPWSDAPGAVRIVSGRHGPCEVDLPRLTSVSVTGSDRDATIHVSGMARTATLRSASADPMTTLRLLKDLAEIRSRSGSPTMRQIRQSQP